MLANTNEIWSQHIFLEVANVIISDLFTMITQIQKKNNVDQKYGSTAVIVIHVEVESEQVTNLIIIIIPVIF